MALSFIGNYFDRHWIETGLTSLDIAMAFISPVNDTIKFGVPTRSGLHVYGDTKIGKSHFAASLGAMIAEKQAKSVLYAPIDTFDSSFLEIMEYSGLTKNPHIASKQKDFETLDSMIDLFDDDSIAVGVLDSISAVQAAGEQEGSVTEAQMGRRAILVSKWVKKMFSTVKHSKTEKIFVATNHIYSNIGTIPGTHTAGGDAIKIFTSKHIKLTKGREGNKKMGKLVEFPEYSAWLLRGKIEKANFGKSGGEFNVFIIGGLGIHRGLTAVYDCLSYGLATDQRKVIYLQGNKIGKLADLVDSWKDDTVFTPFHDALNENKMSIAKDEKVGDKPAEEDEEEIDIKAVTELYES